MIQRSSGSSKGSICIVRHGFYPSELSVRREAEALRENGYRVHVICLRKQGEAAHEIVDDIHVRRVPIGHRRGSIGRYLFEYNAFFAAASLELVRLHLRDRLRAVQVNTMPDYLVFCTLPLRAAGVKVILHMHEPMPELFGTLFDKTRHRPLHVAVKLAERLSLAYADRVLTVTAEMRQNLGRRRADLSKTTVILNVPDDRMFRPDRYTHLEGRVARQKEEDRRAGVFRLLCHGTIEERYGLDLVVGAVARLKNVIPGVQFRFMGQGEHLAAVLAKAQELGVSSRIHYLGFVPFETMIEEILCADVTLVPMRCNPYSVLVHTNKMFEYMALGRPIIASRLDSVFSYFPEDTLLYFEPDDEGDLAERVLHVFNHPQDIQSRIRRTTELYQTYRWEHEKRKYLGVYDALLGDSARER
ncbi:glycosyltransferase family 4 protein [Inquilinus limosus]|uniref:glycosyltransferase family 4 protein n=1 Tax=Inquilinus limosus TaxID=171674 RepID=UPI003F173105